MKEPNSPSTAEDDLLLTAVKRIVCAEDALSGQGEPKIFDQQMASHDVGAGRVPSGFIWRTSSGATRHVAPGRGRGGQHYQQNFNNRW
jgi:hypothetical protein